MNRREFMQLLAIASAAGMDLHAPRALADGDWLYGGAGFDEMFGGSGNDLLSGEADRDWLYGEDGNDLIFGGTGDDVIDGGASNDTLLGGDGADAIFGGSFNDFLYGEAGNDYIVGGTGYNQIWLGSGLDIIQSTRNQGATHYVLDFSVAEGDQVWLVGSGYASSAAALAAAVSVSGGTGITNGSDFIFLAGVAPSQLSASNFALF